MEVGGEGRERDAFVELRRALAAVTARDGCLLDVPSRERRERRANGIDQLLDDIVDVVAGREWDGGLDLSEATHHEIAMRRLGNEVKVQVEVGTPYAGERNERLLEKDKIHGVKRVCAVVMHQGGGTVPTAGAANLVFTGGAVVVETSAAKAAVERFAKQCDLKIAHVRTPPFGRCEGRGLGP